jgi:hypothetical protein
MMFFTSAGHKVWLTVLAIASIAIVGSQTNSLESSSHREAPNIINDPLADNTDVYAFRNPTDPSRMVIIANYIPFQLPQAGPYYYDFGEDVMYDIHIKNNPNTQGDDIIYRFDFTTVNEDPSTFFNIRLGKENTKQTYNILKSTDNGKTFTTIHTNAPVPPPNQGSRSIGEAVGLNSNYHQESLIEGMQRLSTGEKIFVGPVDDPFFIDIGAFFDLGNLRPGSAVDGLKCKNVHTIAMNIPIDILQKDGRHPDDAESILDSEFVIGVWASASRPKITVREANGQVNHNGPLVQVSRLGMPLTNEVIIPIGRKDEWNAMTPYEEKGKFDEYFTNPELALYIDDTAFGDQVPQLGALPLQTNS